LRRKEKIIEALLLISGIITILITIGIIWVLTYETVQFFREVSFIDFVTDTEWTPLFSIKHFGIMPLLVATVRT